MAEPKRKTPARRTSSTARSTASERSASSATEGLVKRLREPRIAAGIGVVLAAVIIAILVLSGDDDGSSDTDGEARGPEAASVEDLQELPGSVGHPVYWAGERPDTQYELTVNEDGNIFIRYLEPDVEIGSRDVPAFTVGTYSVPDSYGALQGVGKQPGAVKARTPDGALVLTNEGNPQSVYIAYPGTDYQIEVYDPDAATALEAATSGQIEPIE